MTSANSASQIGYCDVIILTYSSSLGRLELNFQYDGPKGRSLKLFRLRIMAEWSDLIAGITLVLEM